MPLQATSGAASYDAFGGGVAAVPNYIEDVFSTYLYTGNGGTQTITNSIDLSTKGGLVWIKQRNSTAISGGLPSQHLLFDTNRGANNMLASNSTYQSLPLNGYSFNNTGFTVEQYTNTDGTYPYEGNQSSVPYASWTFRKQAKFFDVVTYTGNSTAGQQIAHNLGSTPGFIIVKATNNGSDWFCYHTSLGATKRILLNTTGASATDANAWNNTAPTSTVFTLGAGADVNYTGITYVAYLFAHNAGGFGLTGTDNVISCGSYTGNGSTDGPTVTLGYEPQFVMIKNATATGNWGMYDVMRGIPTGGSTALMSANTTAAETTGSGNLFDVTATGFQLKTTSAVVNTSGATYIYIAIRRGPMKVPTSGTSVFDADAATTTANLSVTTNFPSDLVVSRQRDASQTGRFFWVDRLRGSTTTSCVHLNSTANSAQTSNATNGIGLQSNTSIIDNLLNPAYSIVTSSIYYNFRRAPSFFDEVCYTGSFAGPRQFSHNLVAVPEMMIVKTRTGPSNWNWIVYHKDLGNTSYIALNSTAAKVTSDTSVWTSTDPTSTIFSVGPSGSGNYAPTNADSYTYVNYLFATCSGVSKVGSYTGTGTTLQVNCGFTGGSRFVLIKRTDSTGDWYVWDSARGIVAGNDPYLLLNSTAAEVTSTDYIDTYSAGFEISSTAPAAINASGGTFIFLAIA